MIRKSLTALWRTRMRITDVTKSDTTPLIYTGVKRSPILNKNQLHDHVLQSIVGKEIKNCEASANISSDINVVRESMHLALSINKNEVLDGVLDVFSEGYLGLSFSNRRELLFLLAKEYDLERNHVCELMKQYLGLEPLGRALGNECESGSLDMDGSLSSLYRIERNLRRALKPCYEVLFERLNTHAGGLKFLTILRADILSILEDESFASLRVLDSFLKEKLTTWLSPASLELHQITWDDPASLLEKILVHEAVHPIRNLADLKRRLGIGRRCFGYLHPGIFGEPLIFIEVALLKNVARGIQEVLWDDPPVAECDATCALFYSISSTQPGLAGINLGKFLIKRVIMSVKRDMPHVSTFATLSPIPGYMQWLISKLTSQSKIASSDDSSESSAGRPASAFQENLLQPDEERSLLSFYGEASVSKYGMGVLLCLLTSPRHEWSHSAELLELLKKPLMRLCARYLLQEKKRGKALDSVANFHLQNGAMIHRINWMADHSEKGLCQSGGIMVNYMYRVENIEEYARSYCATGYVHASSDLTCTPM